MIVAVVLVTAAYEHAQQVVLADRFSRERILVQKDLGFGIRHRGEEQVSKPLRRDVHVELEGPREPERLGCDEEETLILDQWASERGAALVPLGRRLLLQEKRFCHEARSLVAVKAAPVPTVGAGLGDDVEIPG